MYIFLLTHYALDVAVISNELISNTTWGLISKVFQ